MLAGGTEDKEHAMSQKLDTSPAVIGIDIGKNSFHIVGQNVIRQLPSNRSRAVSSQACARARARENVGVFGV
jgi:hypothetical protein